MRLDCRNFHLISKVHIIVAMLIFVGSSLVACRSGDEDATNLNTASPAVTKVNGNPTATDLSASASPTVASSTATLPPTAQATKFACWDAGGEITEMFISSNMLPKRIDFLLYLPPCYQQQPDRQYPVLYLIHGKSFTHTQWDQLGADEMADQLIAAGEVAPFIIVMPRDRIWVDPPDDLFGEALIQELIPWIDNNFRTIDERQSRAIGGLSRGAAWAVHLGFRHWELFGAIGTHSMALFWEDTRMLPRWLESMQPAGYPRIFIDVGNRDFAEIRSSTTWFGELLTSLDIPHEWYSYTGTHNEEYWSAHIEQYLRFYAAGW